MLELRCGAMSAIVAPERGAAVLGWLRDATPILRRATAAAVFGAAGAMGAFPLVPYCNRIAFGRFRWNGRDHTLDRNFGDHPHTLHGIGWKRAWAVETAEPAFAAGWKGAVVARGKEGGLAIDSAGTTHIACIRSIRDEALIY